MADFVAPQFQNPDFLRSAAMGQQMGIQQAMAPGALALQGQEVQGGQLNLDQLRQMMQLRQQGFQAYQQTLQGLNQPNGGQPTQTGQAPGGPSSGTQNGPQGAVSQPAGPQDALSTIADPRRIAANATYSSFLAGLSGGDANKPIAEAQKLLDDRRTSAIAAGKFNFESGNDGNQGPLLKSIASMNPEEAAATVAKNPQVASLWLSIANQRHIDPFNKAAIPRVAADLYNQLGGAYGLNVPLPDEVNPNSGLTPDQRANLDISRGHLAVDQAKLKLQQANQGSFTPEMGELGAALAERGVSLPSGFRSKQQQASLYGGLLSRHPGMSTDDLADLVKSGKINLAGEMKEQTTAGGIVGKVKYAENELTQSIPLALESSGKVSRDSFMPFNKLTQMADTSISDPALVDFKVKTQSVLNAYDMLAARSGTDVGKREETKKLLTTAQSPAAYEAALKAMAQEAQVAHKAGDLSMGRGGSQGSQGAAPVTKTIAGKTYVQQNGKWYAQ